MNEEERSAASIAGEAAGAFVKMILGIIFAAVVFVLFVTALSVVVPLDRLADETRATATAEARESH